MTQEKLKDVKITDIKVGKRLRQIDKDTVVSLAESIEKQELLHPIILREGNILVAGARRLAACQYLGKETIRARVFAFDDPGAELAEIDENLERSPLMAFEWDEHLARREELYQKKYPETKQYSSEQMTAIRRGDKMSPRQDTFAKDTAKLTGKTPRTINRHIKVYRDLDKGVREDVRDSPIRNKQSELTKLSKLPKTDQREVAKRLKSGEITKVPAPPKADAHKAPKDETTEDNWNKEVAAAVKRIDRTVRNELKALSKLSGGHLRQVVKDTVIAKLKTITTVLAQTKNSN